VEAPLREALVSAGLTPPESLARAAGCAQCQAGYDGRVALFSSGHFLQEPDVPWQLLHSAWPHVGNGDLDLVDCIPVIPENLTNLFSFSIRKLSVN
jgi:hypothetical protein